MGAAVRYSEPAGSAARTASLQSPPLQGSSNDAPGRPLARMPKHVRHCANNGSRDWWIYVWHRDKPGTKTRVPYSCRSWRCPVCRRYDASVQFARIREAMQGTKADGWCFLVLTLDRNGRHGGRKWRDAQEAYREISRLNRNLMSRIKRMQKRRGWTVTGNRWIAVVEAHRSGHPHLNLMLYCPELAAELEADRVSRLDKYETADRAGHLRGKPDRLARLIRGELKEHTRAAGWGLQSTAEQARDDAAIAGYVTKLAGEADKVTGEVAKITQAPLNAPDRFRRLRAGKGFLPPRRKNENMTGTLIRRFYDEADGTPMALPLYRVPAILAHDVSECCEHESGLLLEETLSESYYRQAWSLWPELAKLLRPLVSAVPTQQRKADDGNQEKLETGEPRTKEGTIRRHDRAEHARPDPPVRLSDYRGARERGRDPCARAGHHGMRLGP